MTAKLLLLLAVFSCTSVTHADPKKIVTITNIEGVTIEAEVISVVRSKDKASWLCFRKPGEKDLFLYPFTSLTSITLERLSNQFQPGQILVADGLTGPQLDRLEEYLAAGPRERLVLELRDAKRTERLLAREWSRLQEQTWQLQQQLARTQAPEQRQRVSELFRTSLKARDRVGKQLSLLRVEIRRMEERIALLQKIGIPIDDDPFSEP